MADPILLETGTELMTPERLERFLDELRQKGRRKATIDSYREVLRNLCATLPGGVLTPGTWSNWKREMEDQGLQATTINQRLSALNSYLTQIGRRGWCGSEFLPRETKPQPELTRQEYRRLLSAARELHKEKAYLLLKLMGSFGVECRDLPCLTVEAVKAGSFRNDRGKVVALTSSMRAELLEYIRQKGLKEGLVFRTSSGQPIERKYIHWLLEPVGSAAQVEARKVSPRCLRKMYQQTHAELRQRTTILAEKDYQQMLESEQRMFGWDAEQAGARLRV